MNIIVQKFGGVSVRTADCIKNVASLIIKERQKGSFIVVVVSAMAHVTDDLIKKAREITTSLRCTQRLKEYDVILSSGEQVSSALLALALQDLGFKARSWLGWQLPLKSNSAFSEARITHVATKEIYKSLNQGEIPIIAGFQCINHEDRITTLGRGGSDTTALAVAAALSASRCDLYKEVTGIFTADPCIVEDAKKIDLISYKEMLELSSSGAKVLHSRAVEIAMRYKIPTRIVPTFIEAPGTTLVDEVQITRENVITAITHNSDSVVVTINGIPSSQETGILFSLLTEQQMNTDTIIKNAVQNKNINIIFTIRRSVLEQLREMLKVHKDSIKYSDFIINAEISKVSLIGSGIQSYPETIRNVLEILTKHEINILLLSSSESKIVIFVHEKDTKYVMQILHKAFI